MKKKYRSIIVDDDPIVVEQLVSFLNQTDLFEKPYVCDSSTQALVALSNQSFDLLFLDIELPDMTGLDLLRMFPKHPPVCAISMHPAYAVDCYDLGIDDFMVKPITYSRLLRSIHRILLPSHQALQQLPAPALPQQAMGQVIPLPLNFIYLKTGRKIERFITDDIVYLEAFHIYAKLVTSTNTFVVNEQLTTLEQRLTASNFLRVHKSYLVNLRQVTQFKANGLWLGSFKLPIGGTFKTKVQERLNTLGIL